MSKKDQYYLGVDVGGTKILAALVAASGKVVARKRLVTPRNAPPAETLEAVAAAGEALLKDAGGKKGRLRGLGLAVPGIVDPDEGVVVITPNMNLGGLQVVAPLAERFGVPVALGNDVNLGTLGEQWLGAAMLADSAVGIFVGTGIGGGIIVHGQLINGHRGAAAEVGHMRMQQGGPLCGCGNRGCLEALASRTAIERELREGIAAGRKTVLTDLVQGDVNVIRSNVLKKALLEKDELVTEVMSRASATLGEACLQIIHLLDPEVIVLGGGVVEACKFFMIPLVQKAIEADPFLAARPGGRVVVSALGDDAVVLGAVALAQQVEGRDPFKKARKALRQYPIISEASETAITVGGRTYREMVLLRADGKVRKWSSNVANEPAAAELGREAVKLICRERPGIVLFGGGLTLAEEAEDYLRRHGVTYELLNLTDAVSAFNAIKGRKAALLKLGR